MINHRWNDNTCVKCGVKRKKHYSKLLMTITDFPPYDHYLREMIWLFSFDGLKWKADRPDCKIISVNPSVMRSVCAHEDCTEQQAKNLQQAHVIKSLLADLPENRPLYKDSGLWQMRSDDMEEVLIQQGVNETDIEFLARCKASNVL